MSAAIRSYVTVGVDAEVYAIDVTHVREILDHRDCTRLPHAPPWLIGVIDVRGGTVPVVDLRVKLGLPAAAATEHSRILVLELTVQSRPLVVGLRTDRVYEVAEFPVDSLDAAPDVGAGWNSEYIKGIGRLRGEFVILFDMVRLFGADETAELSALS